MAYDTMSDRTVTGFFDTKAQADKAKQDLIAAGFSAGDITVVGNQASTGTTTAATTEPKGFWEELKEFFMPDEDRYTYAEGLRRGGYLLTVRTGDESYDRALDILDRDGSVDMDERESTWRSEGWTGYSGDAAMGAAGIPSSGTVSADRAASSVTTGSTYTETGRSMSGAGSSSAMGSGAAALAPKAGSSSQSRDEAIPIVEEELRIGKRDTNHGRVRVRSYVVEKPVTENVTLRNTSVEVERRPVDRAVNASDAVFQDRTIEAEQHTEEAVVDKQARVTEEIRLKKNVEERTETVSDTVKKTEVEVLDERGNTVTDTGRRV